jgi:hypothetical protein
MALTPLEARMKLTQAGQASWADPDRFPATKCTQCMHYSTTNSLGKTSKAGGFCRLVKTLTRRDGVAFHGASAMACSQYGREL